MKTNITTIRLVMLFSILLFLISCRNTQNANVTTEGNENPLLTKEESNSTDSDNSNKEAAPKILEMTFEQWDEANVKTLVMNAISEHTDWSYISYRDSTTLIHEIKFMRPIIFNDKEIRIVTVYSDYDDNSCANCMGVISAFEFENRGKWRLTNKAVAFANSKPTGKIGWQVISQNNYAITLRNFYGGGYELIEELKLYAFMNDSISSILKTLHFGNSETYYNLELKKSIKFDNNGYYYFLTEEKEKTEDTDTLVTKTYYTFNGSKYEDNHGMITDPSLTSMSRFIDINSIKQKNEGICPTCNGTGTEICPLCGGTGVTNMGKGIECNCVRTYKIELEAGHVTHKPLKWTCLACDGTGNYNN